MKKFFYLLTVIALLASCNQEEVLVETPEVGKDVPQLIGFETFVDKSSRAKGENSTALNDFYTTFYVHGWKTVGETTTKVFDNVPVNYVGNETDYADYAAEWGVWGENSAGWYYQNLRYWDKMAGSYQFSAFTPAPAGVAFDCQPNGLITIGTEDAPVTVDGTNLMASPKDALAYTGFVKDYMTAQATDKVGTVSLTFKHLQAKLNICILLDDEITTAQDVSIQKIQVHNLGDKGYYTNALTNGAEAGVSGWTLTEATAGYIPAVATAYSLNNQTKNYDGYYVLEQLIIPQAIAKYTTDANTSSLSEYTQACVYVEYTIGAETFKSYSPLANIFLGSTSEATSYSFEGGKQYTLNITVGPSPIKFTAEVTPWATAVDGGLEMD